MKRLSVGASNSDSGPDEERSLSSLLVSSRLILERCLCFIEPLLLRFLGACDSESVVSREDCNDASSSSFFPSSYVSTKNSCQNVERYFSIDILMHMNGY